jgi:hypothetical protein
VNIKVLTPDAADLARAMLGVFGREFDDVATCVEPQPDHGDLAAAR